MFCSQCGKEVNENSKFCQSCGYKIGSPSKEETPINTFKDTPKLRTGKIDKLVICNDCGQMFNQDSGFCPHCISLDKSNLNEKKTIKHENQSTKKQKHPIRIGMIILLIIGGILYFMFDFGGSKSDNPKSTVETVVPTPPPPDPLQVLSETPPSKIRPDSELYNIYKYGSDYTDVQRENTIDQIRGSVVQWTLPVYEVRRKDYGYEITTSGTSGTIFDPKLYVSTEIHIQPRNSSERSYIESLKTGDMITFKGKISGVDSFRYIVIDPGILVSGPSVYVETVKNSKQDVPVGDWVEYDRDQYDNICYYKKGKVDKTGNKHVVQVWDKLVYSDSGRDKMMRINNNVGDSNEGWNKLSHTITLSEIDCQNKRERMLSYNTLDTNGKILNSSNYNSIWENIFPNSIRDIIIRKNVCE